MAVARLVSLFEGKSMDSTLHPRSRSQTKPRLFSSSSLHPTELEAPSDTFHISIQPYHFSHSRSTRNRCYRTSIDSSICSSPTSSSPSSSLRSRSGISRSFSPFPCLRRIQSHVDLALAAERDDTIRLGVLEPRPVGFECVAVATSLPPVVLEGIFEVLEGSC